MRPRTAVELTGARPIGLYGRLVSTVATRNGQENLATVVGVTVSAIVCCPVLVRTALAIPERVPLNYNEGWNAYHVAQVLQGTALYNRPGTLFFNNYPPLSFYMVAAMTRVIPDPIIAGRWLSFAAFLCWAVLLVRVARLFGSRHADAWFAGALFIALTLAFTRYVGIDDPQFIGNAVAGGGLVTLAATPLTTRRIVTGGLLLVAAVFIKHNLIALPLSCTVWLLAVDRRRGRQLIAVGVFFGTFGAAVCLWAFGTDSFAQILAPREYHFGRAARMGAQWLLRMSPFAAFFVVAPRERHDRALLFCGIYTATAALVGLLLCGGVGVNSNIFFDATWALCLSAAVTFTRVAPNRFLARSGVRLALLGVSLAPPLAALLLQAPTQWPAAGLTPTRVAQARPSKSGVDFLRAHAGLAACHDLALCFWADKPMAVDFFNL
jgi:hypothetical protein